MTKKKEANERSSKGETAQDATRRVAIKKILATTGALAAVSMSSKLDASEGEEESHSEAGPALEALNRLDLSNLTLEDVNSIENDHLRKLIQNLAESEKPDDHPYHANHASHANHSSHANHDSVALFVDPKERF